MAILVLFCLVLSWGLQLQTSSNGLLDVDVKKKEQYQFICLTRSLKLIMLDPYNFECYYLILEHRIMIGSLNSQGIQSDLGV